MQTWKRLVAILLIVILTMTLFTGCGAENAAPDDDNDTQQGDGTGNSGNSGNGDGTGNSGNSGNSGNTGNGGNSGNTGNGGSSGNSDSPTIGTDRDPTMVVYPNVTLPDPDDGVTVVCIDAGHGYVDSGTVTGLPKGMTERDLVDAYAKALKAELEDRNVVVVLLRNNEVYIDADQVETLAKQYKVNYMPDKLVHDRRFAAYNRSVYANVLHMQRPFDLLISLHADAFTGDSSVGGTRIYYCSENEYTKHSVKLSNRLADAIKAALPDTRAKSYADDWASAYTITKRVNMPAVLIEIGFCTNPKDVQNMLDETWRDTFVTAMADGVENFMK